MTVPSLSAQIYVSISQLVVLLMIAIITMKLIRLFYLPSQTISFGAWYTHLLVFSGYNGYFCMLFASNLLNMTRDLCLAYIEIGKFLYSHQNIFHNWLYGPSALVHFRTWTEQYYHEPCHQGQQWVSPDIHVLWASIWNIDIWNGGSQTILSLWVTGTSNELRFIFPGDIYVIHSNENGILRYITLETDTIR